MYISLASGPRFRSLYRTGMRHHRGGITVYQSAGESVAPEVGFVAGKRVGNAVERNRAKRRLREAVRRVPLSPRTSYVFVASRSVVSVPFPTIIGWLEDAVRLPRHEELA